MGNRTPRDEEQGALDAICAVEDVVGCGWLRESQVAYVRTPDLRVTLRGGSRATVEIIMATLDPPTVLVQFGSAIGASQRGLGEGGVQFDLLSHWERAVARFDWWADCSSAGRW